MDDVRRPPGDDERDLYRSIADHSLELIAVVDEQYTCKMVNQRYKDIFRQSRDYFIDRSIADIFGADNFEQKIKPTFDRCL